MRNEVTVFDLHFLTDNKPRLCFRVRGRKTTALSVLVFAERITCVTIMTVCTNNCEEISRHGERGEVSAESGFPTRSGETLPPKKIPPNSKKFPKKTKNC